VRSRDVLPLLGVLRHGSDQTWTVRSLADELHLSQTAVQRSLARLGETPAYDAQHRRVNWSATMDLFGYALPFVAPASLGAQTRGVPTAWAAPPLSDALAAGGALPPVWPSSDGEVRGLAVTPLDAAALSLAASDPWMYEMLALVDGVRIGDARVRGVAKELLRDRLASREQA
jgi:DNA-binding transcriptional MocR family regulator